jgi:hypothetical protein
MFPPDDSKGCTGDWIDSPKEWWRVWEEVSGVGRERARPLGYLYEPWDWDGVESNGVGEKNQRRREQVAALRTQAFNG